MIDVVFLLLMYFMLSTDLGRPEAALAADLPRESTEPADPFALPEQPITVRVISRSPDTMAYTVRAADPAFAGISSPDEFAAIALKQIDNVFAPDQAWIVVPSEATIWEHALSVFNALRSAGYTRITLAEPA